MTKTLIRRSDDREIEAIEIDELLDQPEARPSWVVDAIESKGIELPIKGARPEIVRIKAGTYAATALRGDLLCFDGQHIFYLNRRDALRHFIVELHESPKSNETPAE
jgi:hypothetical protein